MAGVGPGSYAQRADIPDVGIHGEPRIVPLHKIPDYAIYKNDVNPIGMTVYGADYEAAGVVKEAWVDHMESMIRYFEVALPSGESVLVPLNFTNKKPTGILVQAILGSQFKDVPKTKSSEQITLLEEEKIMAYFGAGTLYATPERMEPLI